MTTPRSLHTRDKIISTPVYPANFPFYETLCSGPLQSVARRMNEVYSKPKSIRPQREKVRVSVRSSMVTLAHPFLCNSTH